MAGDRVGIITNGGGLGVLAVDMLVDRGGTLAALAPETLAALDAALPATWSRANPVDIIGDAPAARYAAAVDALVQDNGHDALLVMNCPTAMTPPAEAAQAVIERIADARTQRGFRRPVFSAWLGSDAQQMRTFTQAGIAAFDTERGAVSGLGHLIAVRRQRQALLRPSPRSGRLSPPDRQRPKRFCRQQPANSGAGLTRWRSAPCSLPMAFRTADHAGAHAR